MCPFNLNQVHVKQNKINGFATQTLGAGRPVTSAFSCRVFPARISRFSGTSNKTLAGTAKYYSFAFVFKMYRYFYL